jgi:hypothetical protein
VIGIIDISWLDWAYKSSTCDVSIVDSAAIYIMVAKFRNTICPPPPQLSLHRRAALSSNSNGTRSVNSRENPKRSLYCEMSVDWNRKSSRTEQAPNTHWPYSCLPNYDSWKMPCYWMGSFTRLQISLIAAWQNLSSFNTIPYWLWIKRSFLFSNGNKSWID